MSRNSSLMRNLLAAAALVFSAGQATAAVEPAGQVVMSVGRTTATAVQGVVRTLAKDAPVYSGELMNTGPNSYLNMRFNDGAFFLLRPDTRFEIQEHVTAAAAKAAPLAKTGTPAAPASPVAKPPSGVVASGTGGSSRAFMSLLKGGFRSVSGLIGKLNREEYRITTPVATIGIRGTRYSARICESECADREELLSLLRAAGRSAVPGQTLLITHVEEGSIFITTATESRLQEAVSTFITLADGSIIPVSRLPRVEQEEQDMPADQCGLVFNIN